MKKEISCTNHWWTAVWLVLLYVRHTLVLKSAFEDAANLCLVAVTFLRPFLSVWSHFCCITAVLPLQRPSMGLYLFTTS